MKQQLYSDLPPELHEADDILHRYGRWARGGYSPARCGSAEGGYKDPTAATAPNPETIALDVDRINKALSKLPMMTLMVIQWLYVDTHSLQAKMRKYSIQPRHMRERHLEGVQAFWRHWKEAQHCCKNQTVVIHSRLIYDLAT